MSKILSPKAWYLVAVGAAALAADGARRMIKKRRQSNEVHNKVDKATVIPMVPAKPVKETPIVKQPDNKPDPPIQAEVPQSAAAPQPTKADDLTEINGIGPTFAKRLAEAGITTFAAIAASTPEYLREVTHATAVANPEEWIAQARLR